MKKIYSSILAIAMLCSLAGCNGTEQSNVSDSSSSSEESSLAESTSGTTESTTEESTSSEPLPEPEPEPISVKLLCAGDNLLHDNIIYMAKRRGKDDPSGYDFRGAYAATAELVAAADLAILNQETIVTDKFPPSNYPMFCSPQAAGDQMVELGFDVMSIGNNHVLDKGEEGLIATLEYWSENHPDIPVYGASLKEKEQIPVLDANGITFAFVGFMEHTNGLSLPKDTACKITYLSETEEVKRQIEAADALADVVVVSAHYGIEVSNTVTEQQLKITRNFVDWGADIVIGTQPHTVQPMEFVEKPDGGKAFVFYCLGNYISSMTGTPTAMVGMLGQLTVTKHPDGTITLENPEAVPIISHINYNASEVEIRLWKDYTEEMAVNHGTKGFTYALAKRLVEEYVCIKDLLD